MNATPRSWHSKLWGMRDDMGRKDSMEGWGRKRLAQRPTVGLILGFRIEDEPEKE